MASDEHRSSIGPAIRQSGASDADEFQARVTALYQTHRDGIYGFLMGQGLTPTVAQEVTQDIFVDLFVALQKGTRMRSEQAWLYTVAGRAAVDHWRREHRQMWRDLDSESSAAVNVPSSEPTPEAQTEHKQRLNRIAAGLRKLSNEHRLCIQLRMQGLRYREIAKILGVSTSTAAEWLISAINRLREQGNG
jgi:RNA polymerase sigma-70 factor, ECF subfamily